MGSCFTFLSKLSSFSGTVYKEPYRQCVSTDKKLTKFVSQKRHRGLHKTKRNTRSYKDFNLNWIGHALRGDGLLREVFEGRFEGERVTVKGGEGC